MLTQQKKNALLINGRGQKLVGAVSKMGVASEKRDVVNPIVGVVSPKNFPSARRLALSLICKSWELWEGMQTVYGQIYIHNFSSKVT